jgi:hypothetical protein
MTKSKGSSYSVVSVGIGNDGGFGIAGRNSAGKDSYNARRASGHCTVVTSYNTIPPYHKTSAGNDNAM